MQISVLSSGSSGNCFYIENNNHGFLVDCGISCKQVLERMKIIGKKPENIKGIFITHEHSDHISGADVFARTFSIPIYAAEKVADECFLCSDANLINKIGKNETINFNGLDIEIFSKSHKAVDPVFFSIVNKKRLSIITDAGFICKNVEQEIKDSDFLCLESNHDLKMLEEGPYPLFLKKWIRSDIGHLSNMQASLGVLEHASSKLNGVILSHLSETNNTPQVALKTFSNLIKERQDLKLQVLISTKFAPTEMIKI
jgi:phosphoribosyl 1,2-cyclic phosphodiesterase